MIEFANDRPDSAAVTVSYPFNFILPWIPHTTITMTSVSQVTIAN